MKIDPERGPVGPETLIAAVMLGRPDAERVLHEEFGLPCFRCPVSFVETVAEGARLHGLDPQALAERLSACAVDHEAVG
ncbi:MAG: DUF1858 domain-containing protein [Planctomycetota bacterium]